MTRKVRLVFEITKADSLFVIHDSVEAALSQDPDLVVSILTETTEAAK